MYLVAGMMRLVTLVVQSRHRRLLGMVASGMCRQQPLLRMICGEVVVVVSMHLQLVLKDTRLPLLMRSVL